MLCLESRPSCAAASEAGRRLGKTRQPTSVTRIVLAALLLAAQLALSPGNSARAQSLADPYQIFARARAYWLQQRYPPLIEYSVAVSVLEGGSVKIERYWSAYDSVDQEIMVDPISDYERAHPTYAAHGVSIKIPLLSSVVGKPQPPTDYLGVPLLAPNYTFGMAQLPKTNPAGPDAAELVREIRAEFHDPAPANRPEASASPGVLPIIERETVYNRAYRVTLVGIESTYGVPAYHLHLHALRDPGRYRLQELWIDTRTFAPIQLIEGINFVNGPGTGVPWRVRFTRIGDGLYVYDETALKAMHYEGLVYPQASVAFENIRGVDELSRLPPLFGPEAPLIMNEPEFP
jgi:hypothetical protein